MVNKLKRFSEIFWNEYIWLPPNVTWKNISPESNSTIQFRKFTDLYVPIPMAFAMWSLRVFLEKYCFRKLGFALGIKERKKIKLEENVILEKVYVNNKTISNMQIKQLAKELNWTERHVERWLRARKMQNRHSILSKFCESCWRCLYYTSIFIYGLCTLWNKPWLWDINECWYTYPYQSMTNDIWLYYMASLTFYWSLCISQFFDVMRKDFWQMFVHHIATIALMSFSWVTNFFRVGTVILMLHDCSDIFLESTKMAKYSGYKTTGSVLLVIFAILWIFTRLGVFPFWVIRNTAIDAPKIVPMFPAYYIFNGLLILLLLLHMFWTYLILKLVYRSFNAGYIEDDVRSESSSDAEDDNFNLKAD